MLVLIIYIYNLKIGRSVSRGRTCICSQGRCLAEKQGQQVSEHRNSYSISAHFAMVRVVCGTDSVIWSWSCRSFEFLVFRLRTSLMYPMRQSIRGLIHIKERLKDDTLADRGPVQGFRHRGDVTLWTCHCHYTSRSVGELPAGVWVDI